ncbi:MAG: DEAD/DEAH box helicase, partial [Desulfosudaceae bacterium]
MNKRGNINEYIRSLVASPRMAGEVVHHEILRRRPARECPASFPAGDLVRTILEGMGVQSLYTHQAEGITHIRQGRHVVVSTPTASGKTFIYNLPVLERIKAAPSARALYLFPLKALAQDQLKAFERMAAVAGLSDTATAAIYDGDTSDYKRKKIRGSPPAVIMTNPDMVHLSLLPYHDSWRTFFENLEIIVIDEIHTYRGVMGSHMARVFRRLLRVCAHYGANPVFVASSATIANPGELAGQLTGVRVNTVENSGAPRGRRNVVMLNPRTGP